MGLSSIWYEWDNSILFRWSDGNAKAEGSVRRCDWRYGPYWTNRWPPADCTMRLQSAHPPAVRLNLRRASSSLLYNSSGSESVGVSGGVACLSFLRSRQTSRDTIRRGETLHWWDEKGVGLGVRESWKEIYKQKVRRMIRLGDEEEGKESNGLV